MKLPEILEFLQERNIAIDLAGDELIARASSGIIDSEVLGLLKLNKKELLDALRHGITPAMLPLVDLTQAEIDRIVATVPQGVENVQDIYPLAPLQEGILFHHLLATRGDLYLSRIGIAFDSRRRLDQFVSALQAVIDRHDILRAAVLWNELSQPIQVICRRALLPIHECTLDGGDALQQLLTRTDPQHVRLDLQRAPLLTVYVAQDPQSQEWLLMLLTHHLVCDHITLGLILTEIQALLQGHAEDLPPPLPYRNFIARARSVSTAEHEAYFRLQLGDLDQPTTPFDLLDVRGDAREMTEASLPLNEQLSLRIRETARQQGVTAAVLFHVAWAQVLACCSGRDDVVFGTVLLGRLQGSEGADQVLGLFINTLPIRISLAGRPAGEVVADTYRRLSELLLHEQASLAMAQRCSSVPATMPLFTALLNYRHTYLDAEKSPAAAAAMWEGMRVVALEERTNYPITMNVDDLGQRFSLLAQCVRGASATRMAAYLQIAVESLVTALARDSRQQILSLSILPPEERHQLLEEWNASEAPCGAEPAHRLFEAQATAHPDATALRYQELVLSYAQLNAKADRLARYLLDAGVTCGARVGVYLSRSPELVIAVLGILKAGAAYVPLDPILPKERLGYMMQDAQIGWALLEGATVNRLPLQGTDVILMDGAASEEHWLEEYAADTPGQEIPLPSVAATDLAYVIYTSGSTGRPKGVGVEHRGLSNYLAHAVATYLPGLAGSVVSSPLSFDATLTTLLPPLLVGKPVWLLPDDERTLARLSERLFAPGEGWLFKITPAHLEALSYLERPVASGPAPHCIVVGGEQLAAATLQRWKGELLPQASFVNEYGPTETVVGCSVWTLATAGQLAQLAGSAAAPIGRPIANMRMYLLDAQRQPVPIGVTGEIHIGGVQVARGYLNRPDLTQERFLPDPFAATPDARMYKTGDLGRYLPDGNIVFLGRNDFQVKIRGFRIELGEIEAQLLAHPGVREALVIAREDTPGEKRLVAYVVPEEGAQLSVPDLRARLASTLAEYMVPAAYVILASLPLTPNGKLDRHALPAPEGDAYLKRAYEAPTTEIEIAIAAIWQQLLHLDRVGRHDHFFELGGHSLFAVQLISRLRQVLGADVTLRDLFATPTLAALAQRVAEATALVLPPIRPVDRMQNLPLSWAQQRLWFLAELDPAASVSYHMPAALRLRGSLDPAALTATLDRIVARHEILRTHFVKSADGTAVQIIAPSNVGFALSDHDLTGLGEDEQRATVDRLRAEQFQRPFDLERGPMIRGSLLRLADKDHILLLCQHHIISDGWSIGILVREITTLYAAFTQGLPDPLPPLNIQYADYALWQRQWLQKEALTQLDFWRNHLVGAPALLELPTDRPRPARQSYAGAHIPLVLPADLSAALKALSQRHGTTLFMTLLAGWSILLARLTGQSDLVIGTSIANRQRMEVESLIGFFVNALALRIRLEDDPTVTQLLQRIKDITLAAYAHQDVPFEQVVEALRPVRTLSHSALFQVLLALINPPENDVVTVPGLEVTPLSSIPPTTHFDLTLLLADTGTVISGNLHYSSDLFERATIERVAGHFTTLLRAIVADESQRIGTLPLLTAAERNQLLVEWNATRAPHTQQLIHEIFEAQAAAHPEAQALMYQDQCLTYAELNARTNQLARYLLALGVRPDDRVALCLERGLDMVVGLLGILKAGAAYVPLDPTSPEARLAFMLTDCAPVALLTQATLAEGLPAMSMLHVVILDDGSTQAAIARHASDNLEAAAMGLVPSNLAYVIYTSGSTGSAKGVMVEHSCAVNFWHVLRSTTHSRCPPQARIGLNAAYFFDMSLKGLLQLLSGHCLVIIPQAMRADGAALLRFLEQHRIDAFDCTPSQLDFLLAAGLLDSSYRPRSVLIGGEAIDTSTWQRLGRSPIAFYNMYGPTECTVDATIGLITGSASHPHIGRPVANTAIYILDSHRQPVPIGVTGEIYIGGVQVARGYLNCADLTRERFLPDPFSATAQGRMYKTGDLGRYLPDGNIVFCGRNDFQVKIRGFRIELGEIEARLLEYRGICEAVVIAREDTPGDKRLVAYLVLEEGAQLSIADLRVHLASALAEYMVPAAYVTLRSLPLTPNGKLDRQALPAPEADAFLKRTYEAPANDIEVAIAGIWEELLHVEHVGRHDHFFELGGHSLLAVEMITRMRQLGLHVDIRALFIAPTLLGIAGATERIKRITL